MIHNVMVKYCLYGINLLLEDLDTRCFGVEFLNVNHLGCQWIHCLFAA